MSAERRRRFLAGEGVLTAQEIVEWALEIGEPRVDLPKCVGPEQELMVAVVDHRPSLARVDQGPFR